MLMPSSQHHHDDDRSIGDLFSQLTAELKLLFNKEIELAKVELSREVAKARRGAVATGAGAVVAYIGALALTAAVIALLATFMPVWLSALIVAAVLLIAGTIMIRRGTRMLKTSRLVPVHTIDTLKEDTQWAKDQFKSKAGTAPSSTRPEHVVPMQRPSATSGRR
jgi:uncharacterized membrane protein YqjE